MALAVQGEVASVSSSQHTADVFSSLNFAVKAEYRCGYCDRVALSVSGDACGRAPRIRCECGGLSQDGKRRLHSKYATPLVVLSRLLTPPVQMDS